MSLSRRGFLKQLPALATLGGVYSAPLHAGRKSPQIVIAGGGFAGLNCARWLKHLLPELPVTLVDREDQYVRCPGSNLVIAGFAPLEGLRYTPSKRLSHEGIRFRKGDVSGVDPIQKRLHLKDGSSLPYDRLIVAPGIDFRWNGLEGLSEATRHQIPHAWRAGSQTAILRDQIAALPSGGLFMMTIPANPYRCPPGPYERASLVAARLKRVNPRAKILLLDAKSKFSKEKGFKAAWTRLYPGMIEWISLESEGTLDHIDPKTRQVTTAFNRFHPDVLNVIPPQKAGVLAERLDLVDDSGWCPVDPLSFESTRIPGIHVIGDAVNYGGIPKSAFAAQTEGRTCALAVALLLGELPLPTPRLINHCYSLIAQDEAISITGVYGMKPGSTAPEVLTLMESSPDDDLHAEYTQAMDWFQVLTESTFGKRD
jgi:sulfide dehydrogenase [flavocytochrome c] flavoprotein subunit